MGSRKRHCLGLFFSQFLIAVLFSIAVFAATPLLGDEETETPPPFGALAGRVFTPDGVPATNTTVYLILQDSSSPSSDPTTLERTQTNADGRFLFPDVEKKYHDPEKYRWIQLLAQDDQKRLGSLHYIWRSFDSGRPDPFCVIPLCPVANFRGRLIDEEGKPIAGGTLSVQQVTIPTKNDSSESSSIPLEERDRYRTKTDADGFFTLHNIPVDGSIRVFLDLPKLGKCNLVWKVKNDDVIAIKRTGSVLVKAIAPSKAKSLAGIGVYLSRQSENQDAAAPQPTFFFPYNNPKTKTDREGVVRLEGVPPGKYCLEPEFDNADIPFLGSRTAAFEVKPGETVEVSLPLRTAIPLTGRVVEAPSGKPIADVPLYVSKVNEQNYTYDMRSTKTDADGKYHAYVDPGRTIVTVEGNVSPRYIFREQGGTRPIIDVQGPIAYPDISLWNTSDFEVQVFDVDGKPAADAELQCLVQRRMQNVEILRTDAEGRATLSAIDPGLRLAVRARTKNGISDVREIVPEKEKTPLKLEILPGKAASFHGVCVASGGVPIPYAVLKLESVWMLGSSGIGLRESYAETNAQGRFEILGLWPGRYKVVVLKDGYSTAVSKQYELTSGEACDAGKITLVDQRGVLEGKAVDSAGKPLAGVNIFEHLSVAKKRRMVTQADGKFRIEGLKAGTTFVFGQKEGYRLSSAAAVAPSKDMALVLRRDDEPIPPWKPLRAPAESADEQKIAVELMESVKTPLADGSIASAYRWMGRIDLEKATEWTQHDGKSHSERVRLLTVEKLVATDPEEALSLLSARSDVVSFQSLQQLFDHTLPSDRILAEKILEEAILMARRLKQPERIYCLANAGGAAFRSGKENEGRKVIDEAAAMAEKLSLSDRNAAIRGWVAADLALYDVSRALALVETIESKDERENAVAGVLPLLAESDLDRALRLIVQFDSQSDIRDRTRLKIAYRIAPKRLEDALRIVESLDTLNAEDLKIDGYGWLAVAIAPRDKNRAWDLIDKAMNLVMKSNNLDNAWKNTGARTGWILSRAQEVEYPDMATLIAQVLAVRPYAPSQNDHDDILHKTIDETEAIALVDAGVAQQLLATVAPRYASYKDIVGNDYRDRNWYQAWAMADLPQVTAYWKKQIETARTDPAFKLDQTGLDITLEFLTSPVADRLDAILINNSTYYWRP